ncbi:MAG: S-adenosyl-l-methionine hydroxide adenosyltransferase family protein, partial [Acidobacteriota bacterium]
GGCNFFGRPQQCGGRSYQTTLWRINREGGEAPTVLTPTAGLARFPLLRRGALLNLVDVPRRASAGIGPLDSHQAPIVTLTTDFGDVDGYVAEMKGRILSLCPAACLVDICHKVPPHDIEVGAYLLARTLPAFPAGSIHLAVIDPGVGSPRRGLLVRTQEAVLIGPDNGLLSGFFPAAEIRALDPQRVAAGPPSATFQGRDLFAPAAARTAAGEDPRNFSTAMDDPVRLERTAEGRVLQIDWFGNCITSLTAPDLASRGDWVLETERGRIGRFVRTYAQAPPGEPVFLVGSGGYLEIAVREASAARKTGLARGMWVKLKRKGD